MTDAEREGSGLHAERSSADASDDAREEAAVELPPLRVQRGGELGRGGMGVVTAAFDPVLERTVAVKHALEPGAASEQRLLREARLAARLDHPAIVGVLDVGRDEEGRLAAVLPVRGGRSLGEAVASASPSQELLRALLVVAQAVAYAHARGVVHRDLSPGNVRLGEEGAVWVIDWGLAATLEDSLRGGFAGGTAGYTAPEQREGRPVDARGDVWSLGALLHLVCTGRAPSAGLERPPGCPRPLWAIVQKALQPAPERRYADAHAFAADLARWLDGQPVEAWPEGWLARLARRARRRPRLAAGVVVGLLAALVATTSAAVLIASAQQRARRATAQLLVESAERALRQDDVATARRLAREALEVSDSLRARGVLAATARVAAVELTPLDDGDCEVLDELAGARLCLRAGRVSVGGSDGVEADDATFLSGGRWVAVSRGRSVVELRDASGRLLASEPLAGGVPRVRVSVDRQVATVTVPEGLIVAREGLTTLRPCTPGHAIRFALARPTRLEVLCADDALAVFELDGGARARRPG
ncbi:MAG: protein kinase domain-containing protein, partial [Myxococcota bacterium]